MKNNKKVRAYSSALINYSCITLVLIGIFLAVILPNDWSRWFYLIPAIIILISYLIYSNLNAFSARSYAIPQLEYLKKYTLLNYFREKDCAVLLYAADPDDMARIDTFYEVFFFKPEEVQIGKEFLAIYNGKEKKFYLMEEKTHNSNHV
ncbi:MAG: YbjO family protein [Patescibacteria group bacterium]|jgi:hypothetical protein